MPICAQTTQTNHAWDTEKRNLSLSGTAQQYFVVVDATAGRPFTTNQGYNDEVTGIGTIQPTPIGPKKAIAALFFSSPLPPPPLSRRSETGSTRYHGTVSTTGRPWIDLDSSDSERDAVSTDFGRFDPPPPPAEPLPPPPVACFSRLRNPSRGVPAL